MSEQDSELIEGFREMFAEANGMAMTFQSVMVSAGYAGFFALWAETKEFAHTYVYAGSGLLILLSLACFVTFHVVNMAVAVRGLQLMASIALKDPIAAMSNRRAEAIKRQNNLFLTCWSGLLLAIVTPLVIGLLMVGVSYAIQIVSGT